jgi:hypothetical protein
MTGEVPKPVTPRARRLVCEIERYGLDENVEGTMFWEAWRMLELAHAGSLDTTNVRDQSIPGLPRHCINNGLVHAWKCLTRGGPLWAIMLLAAFAVLGSGQRKCR